MWHISRHGMSCDGFGVSWSAMWRFGWLSQIIMWRGVLVTWHFVMLCSFARKVIWHHVFSLGFPQNITWHHVVRLVFHRTWHHVSWHAFTIGNHMTSCFVLWSFHSNNNKGITVCPYTIQNRFVCPDMQPYLNHNIQNCLSRHNRVLSCLSKHATVSNPWYKTVCPDTTQNRFVCPDMQPYLNHNIQNCLHVQTQPSTIVSVQTCNPI